MGRASSKFRRGPGGNGRFLPRLKKNTKHKIEREKKRKNKDGGRLRCVSGLERWGWGHDQR